MDGNEGLGSLSDRNHSILFCLDLNLPGMDGLSIQQLRAEIIHTSIILRQNPTQEAEGLGLQNDYLTKPFILEELEARIRSHTPQIYLVKIICLTCAAYHLIQKQDLPRLIICHYKRKQSVRIFSSRSSDQSRGID